MAMVSGTAPEIVKMRSLSHCVEALLCHPFKQLRQRSGDAEEDDDDDEVDVYYLPPPITHDV